MRRLQIGPVKPVSKSAQLDFQLTSEWRAKIEGVYGADGDELANQQKVAPKLHYIAHVYRENHIVYSMST